MPATSGRVSATVSQRPLPSSVRNHSSCPCRVLMAPVADRPHIALAISRRLRTRAACVLSKPTRSALPPKQRSVPKKSRPGKLRLLPNVRPPKMRPAQHSRWPSRRRPHQTYRRRIGLRLRCLRPRSRRHRLRRPCLHQPPPRLPPRPQPACRRRRPRHLSVRAQ